MSTPTSIVAYLALFAIVGFLFIFVNLLIGRLVRPQVPNQEKLEIYECGEPTIGSSFVQFDLRFYVVALLFIIFDVEVAFFFPWAAVFGKVNHLADPNLPVVVSDGQLVGDAADLVAELGLPAQAAGDAAALRGGAASLGLVSLADIAVFFFVLMMGFAYVWYRGDLDWVRAVSQERGAQPPAPTPEAEREMALSA